MTVPRYDKVDDFYIRFVDRGLSDPSTLFYQTIDHLLTMLGDAVDSDLSGQHMLDLCCGEGHIARALAERGALATGIDLSEYNIATARERNERLTGSATVKPTYVVDDAQTLSSQDDDVFDLVVCKMALMDVPDIGSMFQSVNRVLRPNGIFIAGLLHPCFETPFAVPFERFEDDDEGNFVSLRVQRYFDEGHWNSGGTGVRGHVGAYHRTISTYVNELIGSGFQLIGLEEPLLMAGEQGSTEAQSSQQFPRILFWKAQLS